MASNSSLKALSGGELKKLIAEEDHNEYEDEDGYWIHAHWDCNTCEAEAELEHRRYLKNSRKAGAFPAFGKVGVSGSTHKNIAAEELVSGMYARYLSRPGVSDYPFEYAEALEVTRVKKGKRVKVIWRMSNSPDSLPFEAVYKPSERVNVSYATYYNQA